MLGRLEMEQILCGRSSWEGIVVGAIHLQYIVVWRLRVKEDILPSAVRACIIKVKGDFRLQMSEDMHLAQSCGQTYSEHSAM